MAGIPYKFYIHKIVQAFNDVNHTLRKEQEENLAEFFDIERDENGKIQKMRAREVTVDLIDRYGYANALDFIQGACAVVVDEAEINSNVDVDVEKVHGKEKIKSHGDFEIMTSVKRGFFGGHNEIKMKLKLKSVPESEGMRILRTLYHERLMDEIKGFSKVKRETKDETEAST